MSLIIEPTIIAALSSTIASVIAALYSAKRKRNQKQDQAKTNQILKRKVSEISVDLGFVKFTQSLEPAVSGIPREEILDQLENRILTKLQNIPVSTE